MSDLRKDTMHHPRSTAYLCDREKAQEVADHLTNALDAGAQTILLYTTLDPVPENPTDVNQFPPPELLIHEDVYVIGLGNDPEHFLARFTEFADHIDKSEEE